MSAGGWGWRQFETDSWRPQGERVGWLAGDDLYLEPEASYAAAQRLAETGGELLPVSRRALHRRLNEENLLVGTEPKRGALTVRRVLDGQRRDVLHLRAGSLTAPQSDHADQGADAGHSGHDAPTASSRVTWSEPMSRTPSPDHTARPEFTAGTREHAGDGRVGRVAAVLDEQFMGDREVLEI
jgi:hypothetical protein